jgi:hypothetical protein
MMILSGIVQARGPHGLSEKCAPISEPTQSRVFLEFSLKVGPKISHALLVIIENRPDGRKFHFLL